MTDADSRPKKLRFRGQLTIPFIICDEVPEHIKSIEYDRPVRLKEPRLEKDIRFCEPEEARSDETDV